ncbi:hypothetical protein D0809_13445 [Flavobacterium circumlabens]|uniref:Uncharacterized protein n=1 Tax=Flavobacterium circumlabens TaxID=2133765 RepID=A0A4Y7UDK9_9FLAO|nr:hypothetical protein EV142_104243 [Flavobacterium circumlabens]TEB43892.1 hypothetical protein D0809_13445 [Flavobacterium circumlabens]
MFKFIELIFIFFSKIYIFFYKEKSNYWKIFPIVIMSTILMINIEIVLLQFFYLNNYYALFIILPLILLNVFFRKRDYNWVNQYSISLTQKVTISTIIIVDFIIMGILLNLSRSAYIASH